MKNVRHLIGAGLLLACAVASAAEITLFENEYFNGRRFRAGGTVSDLGDTGFNDRASSLVVRSGRWQVCSDSYFRGRCVTLEPGEYPSLGHIGLAGKVSSLREVGFEPGPSNPPPGPGPGPGPSGPRIVMYEAHDFGGRSVTLDGPIDNMERVGFNDRARSAVVYGGTWQLCEDAFFNGTCSNYGPGRYRDIGGGVDGKVSSARLVGGGGGGGPVGGGPVGGGPVGGGPVGGGNPGGGNWGGGARVILYESPGFGGRSLVITNDMIRDLDPSGFNDRARSIRVERGYWVFCSDSNFNGECRTFAPGDYPDLPIGLAGRISSGRRISNEYPYQQGPNWGR